MLITPKINRLAWLARVVSWRVEAMVLHWFDRQTVHIDCTSRGYCSHLLSEVDRGLDFKLLSHICLLPSLLLLPFLFFLILFVACWDAVDGTYKSNNTKDSRYCDDLCVFAVITRAGPTVLASVWSKLDCTSFQPTSLASVVSLSREHFDKASQYKGKVFHI